MPEALPKCVYFKHGAYYLVKKAKWYFLTKHRDQVETQLFVKFGIRDGRVPYGAIDVGQYGELKRYVLLVMARAKQNAKGRSIKEFRLTAEDVIEMLSECEYKCSVTGTPFDMEWRSQDGRRPYAPSIDRINNSKGYTRDNCRLVCLAANYAMNTWGEGVLFRMMSHAAKQKVLDGCL